MNGERRGKAGSKRTNREAKRIGPSCGLASSPGSRHAVPLPRRQLDRGSACRSNRALLGERLTAVDRHRFGRLDMMGVSSLRQGAGCGASRTALRTLTSSSCASLSPRRWAPARRHGSCCTSTLSDDMGRLIFQSPTVGICNPPSVFGPSSSRRSTIATARPSMTSSLLAAIAASRRWNRKRRSLQGAIEFTYFTSTSLMSFLWFDRAAGFLSSRPQDADADTPRLCQGWPPLGGHRRLGLYMTERVGMLVQSGPDWFFSLLLRKPTRRSALPDAWFSSQSI